MTTFCGELNSDQFTHIFFFDLTQPTFYSPLMRKYVGNTPIFIPEDMLSSAESFWSAKSVRVDADSL